MFRSAPVPSHPLPDGRTVVLRRARERDAADLVRILDATATEPSRPLLHVPGGITVKEMRYRLDRDAGPDQYICVAECGGAVVGSLEARRFTAPAVAHVCELGLLVARDFRSLGIGGLLLVEAERWAGGQGVTKLVLSVFPHNTAALRFYERHGFAREGVRRGQFRRLGVSIDEVLMARFVDGRAKG
jgi:RimJ/RimL family protein N-acetyltransferase